MVSKFAKIDNSPKIQNQRGLSRYFCARFLFFSQTFALTCHKATIFAAYAKKSATLSQSCILPKYPPVYVHTPEGISIFRSVNEDGYSVILPRIPCCHKVLLAWCGFPA